MNKPPVKSVKLTTVVVAVFVLAVSAMLSNYTVASEMPVKIVSSK